MCGAMQGRMQAEQDMKQPSQSMEIAGGIPPGGMMGFTEDELYRRKALQDIINTPGYDPATVREAQRQWIQMQKGSGVRGV